MTLGAPALVFTALMTSEIEPSVLTALSFASLACDAGLTLVFMGVLRISRLGMRVQSGSRKT